MTSHDLRRLGFDRWLPFTAEAKSHLLNNIPDRDGVYIIRSSQPFGRYRGQSDIVYVGSSANATRGLKGRISSFFRPGPSQYTSKRVKALLDLAEKLEMSFKICTSVEARNLEKDIIRQYVVEHQELPPSNRSEPR